MNPAHLPEGARSALRGTDAVLSLVSRAAPASLAEMPLGFDDPVHASQTTFRCVLDAMARPGRVQPLEAATVEALRHPAALSPAMAAALLTLTDADTRVLLHASLAQGGELASLEAFGRFHTGLVASESPAGVDFAFTRSNAMPETLLKALRLGSDEVPQDGATLVIDAPFLLTVEEDGQGRARPPAHPEDAELTPWVRLTGPGVQHAHGLAVGGLSLAFWRARAAMQPLFPRGVDLVFTSGTRIAAVPRSTTIEIAPAWGGPRGD